MTVCAICGEPSELMYKLPHAEIILCNKLSCKNKLFFLTTGFYPVVSLDMDELAVPEYNEERTGRNTGLEPDEIAYANANPDFAFILLQSAEVDYQDATAEVDHNTIKQIRALTCRDYPKYKERYLIQTLPKEELPLFINCHEDNKHFLEQRLKE